MDDRSLLHRVSPDDPPMAPGPVGSQVDLQAHPDRVRVCHLTQKLARGQEEGGIRMRTQLLDPGENVDLFEVNWWLP